MMFKSTSAMMEGDKIMVTGDLTMHGVTKSIALPVTVLGIGTHPQRNTPLAGFETELTVLCSDFGINSWANFAKVLGDEVRVNITIEAGPPRQGRGQGRRGGGEGRPGRWRKLSWTDRTKNPILSSGWDFLFSGLIPRRD